MSVRKAGLFILFLAAALFCIFEIYALLLFFTEAAGNPPANLGNFVSVKRQIKPESGTNEFYFAVVGDTKGCGTFERIFRNISKVPIKFFVLLGDCVRKPSDGYHSYFRSECRELNPRVPMFYVVGNHDVDENDFSVAKFEKAYGPTNFSFKYHKQLFVFLRILDLPYDNRESLDFLGHVLETERSSSDHIFLFMHIPPRISPDYQVKGISGSRRLVSLIDAFSVDYVVAADFHGYARVKRKNTVYLITGGGGAHLRRVRIKQFHHGIVFRVGKRSVSEHIVVVDRHEDFQDQLERYVLGEFIPFVKHFPVVVFFINVATIVFLGYVYFMVSLAWEGYRSLVDKLLLWFLDLFRFLHLCPHRGRE